MQRLWRQGHLLLKEKSSSGARLHLESSVGAGNGEVRGRRLCRSPLSLGQRKAEHHAATRGIMEETGRRDQHISDGGTLAEPPSMRSLTAWPALLARVDARFLVDGGLLLSPERRWRCCQPAPRSAGGGLGFHREAAPPPSSIVRRSGGHAMGGSRRSRSWGRGG
jgi:hypothetical protein